MARKILSIIATAGLIALGGVTAGVGPASAAETTPFTCPDGYHVISMGGASDCMSNPSGGGTGGDQTVDLGGGGICPANTTRAVTGPNAGTCVTNPDPTCPSGQRWHSVGPGMGFCETAPKVIPAKPAPAKPAPKPPVKAAPKPVVKPIPSVKAGATLKAVQTGWAKGTKLKFQWLRNGKPISKATGSAFKARTADRGAKLSVRVTGTKWGRSTVKVGTAYLVR